ncbi:LCP family protein [Fictibacillus gelatini]|uniref:LCP family protein n=1 Tax=Fictibacillus gelatini TaxID=225985 RepID=UPI000688B051|nr:LCP family protein [Fictibacillus gelatini]
MATHQRSPKSPFKRLLRSILAACLLLLFSVCGYGGYLAYKLKTTADASNVLPREKSDLRKKKVTIGKDPVTILLLGVEKYGGSEPPHSDSMMLVTLNPKTKQTSILSIPRDTRTYIPIEKREDKMTHAYAFGSEKGKGEAVNASIESVEHFLHVPVDYYVTVNFKAFKEVVDDLGGVTVNVPFSFKQHAMNAIGGGVVSYHKGEMHLDGREALTFAQMRKKDPQGDFGRQKRQQEVLQAVADKALSIKSVTKADNLLETVGDNVTTNISMKELLKLRSYYESIQGKKIDRYVFTHSPDTNKNIGNVYYFEPKEEEVEKISRQLQKNLGL